MPRRTPRRAALVLGSNEIGVASLCGQSLGWTLPTGSEHNNDEQPRQPPNETPSHLSGAHVHASFIGPKSELPQTGAF